MNLPRTTVSKERLGIYPDMNRIEIDRRQMTNALIDSWESILTAFGAVVRIDQRMTRIQTKLADPVFADIAEDDPLRADAMRKLVELERERDAAITVGPTSKARGGLKHRLDCFAGLLSASHPSLQSLHILGFGGRTSDESVALMDAVYRKPDLVEGQRIWPQIMECYEDRLPDHLRNPYWRENRELAERQRIADAGGKPVKETEWQMARKQLVRMNDVPF